MNPATKVLIAELLRAAKMVLAAVERWVKTYD